MVERYPDKRTWGRFWNRKRDVGAVYPSSPSVLKAITSKLDLARMKVLEVGAGTGRDSVELAKLGADVTVLDFSPDSLKIIEAQKDKHGLANLRLVEADALAMPFEDGEFDLVFHQGLLEHFRNPHDLLREQYRVTKPGGYALCDVPQTVHVYTIVKEILIAFDKWFAGWETQYTMHTLKKLMREVGFDVIYTYSDWMRPCFAYRVLREVLLPTGITLPMYPLKGSRYQKWKDRLLDISAVIRRLPHPVIRRTGLRAAQIEELLLLPSCAWYTVNMIGHSAEAASL